MRTFITIVFLLYAFLSNAQVEMLSVYFVGDDIEFTNASQELLMDIKKRREETKLQLIELNIFTEDGISNARSKKIGEQRLVALLDILEAGTTEREDASINNYGKNRIDLNFSVDNWNRIDVYFGWIEETIEPPEVPEIPEEEEIIEIVDIEEVQEVEEPAPEIKRNTPIILPIKFEGNKTKIRQDSYPLVEELANTLKKYPELTAHIRGHVCCVNKKQKSKKRAKSVYKALIKSGISPDRISYNGYSNKVPLVYPERTEKDRSANRRVDVIFK